MTTNEPIGGGSKATTTAAGLQLYRALLLLAVALSAYLYLPLISGGRLIIPSYPTVALIPLLFLAVHKDLSLADKLFLPKITFILLLSIALSPGYAQLTEKFLSLVQFCLALAVAVMTVRLMQQLHLHTLERVLLALWCLLLAGSALEVLGITRGISDAFRAWAYQDMYTLYDGDLRDITFVGWVRPKVFATEPSAVSKMFIASINAWLLVRVTGTKAAVVAAFTGVMFMIMGSPMFVVSGVITLAILVWNKAANAGTRVAMVLAALIVSVLFVTFFGETAFSTLESRVDRIGETEATGELEIRSENLRSIIPWITLGETLSRWPIFGVGFGGKEIVLAESALSEEHFNYRQAMGANAVAQVGIYLGLLGGALFVWLLLKEASRTGARRLGLMLAIIFLFSMLMGGLDSFRYWGHIALLWGALAIADSGGDRSPEPRRRKTSVASGFHEPALARKAGNS
jgi:hypothetical protein